MTIPNASDYPIRYDNNTNLYEVKDELRLRLSEDYNPGDTYITVLDDQETIALFPSSGIITLTEQCSDAELRAISFYYSSKTSNTFEGIEVLPEFLNKNTSKPKLVTNVTQNVMSIHHNSLKNALISVQEFAGIKGSNAPPPPQGIMASEDNRTMEERINYLRNIALTPKAWFKVDKNIGLAPLEVTFTDQSFRLGTDGTSDSIKHEWDFGDGDTAIDPDGGTISKTYSLPGIYTVKLKVTNDFGNDEVIFEDLINARFPAPDYAEISFEPRIDQILTPGNPPKIRSVVNSIIDLEVTNGNDNPIDPIISYTWSLSDDLTHTNSSKARAVFSVGGLYDLTLRVDTQYGAYRITNYAECFDIVEKINLWLWLYNPNPTLNTSCGIGEDNYNLSVSAHEFGLISETFKQTNQASLQLNVKDSFLNGVTNEDQQKREFHRNNGFAQLGSTTSGKSGTGLIFWASGRCSSEPRSEESIYGTIFNGFQGTYNTPISGPKLVDARSWNWIGLASPSKLYFALGLSDSVSIDLASDTSENNDKKTSVNLGDFSVNDVVLSAINYKNGAEELRTNQGVSIQGDMSVYRSTWHKDAGYVLRNSGVGSFFRIRSFYKTNGVSSELFQNLTKLSDMTGSAKVEGQLVSMSSGVYFFNNSGSVSVYNPISSIWGSGGPGNNSASFRQLQDNNVVGFDNSENTLLAASDGDRLAYLSYDYSQNAFIKFNETDTTFSSVSARPVGNQWSMAIF